MSCESDTARVVRARGRRLTVQRAKILSALRHAGEHCSAEQILDSVRESDPHADISLSTVYRTLEMAMEQQLTSELRGATGISVYEWDEPGTTHHHLQCTNCGQTDEVELASVQIAETEILAKAGFEPDIRHLAIPGRCAACREADGD